MIIIVDYNMGNPASIKNMLRKLGAQAIVSSLAVDVAGAKKLIIPGVGAFDQGIKNLYDLNLTDILYKKIVQEKIPVLGVCLGMQLMAKRSEEGERPGLGWIDADIMRFSFTGSNAKMKIPHMGWNTVVPVKGAGLFDNLENREAPRFYFAHSYHMRCRDGGDIAATTNYGYDFVSAIHHGNIFGVQFHPEKSHKFGLALLKSFAEF